MNEKLEELIQSILPNISIPEIDSLRACCDSLSKYPFRSDQYSQKGFKDEVEYQFYQHTFGFMQDIATASETTLCYNAINPTSAFVTLCTLTQALDTLEQHVKYSIAVGQATREFIENLSQLNHSN